jgi:hypothetical protein
MALEGHLFAGIQYDYDIKMSNDTHECMEKFLKKERPAKTLTYVQIYTFFYLPLIFKSLAPELT